MTSSSFSTSSRINLPRMILWLASIVVAVAGFLLMLASNTNEAAIYTAGKADYPKLFAAQSGSTVGGYLIAVGVLGALLALASMTLTRRDVVAPATAVVTTPTPEAVEPAHDEEGQDDHDVTSEAPTAADAPAAR
jgi:hypothetical protein